MLCTYCSIVLFIVYLVMCISTLLDPVHVIGLYPNLLPADLRQSLSSQHPTKPPTLSGADLVKGMNSLIPYLTQASETCILW